MVKLVSKTKSTQKTRNYILKTSIVCNCYSHGLLKSLIGLKLLLKFLQTFQTSANYNIHMGSYLFYE